MILISSALLKTGGLQYDGKSSLSTHQFKNLLKANLICLRMVVPLAQPLFSKFLPC